MKKAILILFAILFLSYCLFGQSVNKISGKCTPPYQLQYTTVEVIRTGDIYQTPCGDRTNFFNGNIDFTNASIRGVPTINGTNYTTLSGFQTASDYTVNTLFATLNTDEITYRYGANKAFFETFQSPTGTLNSVRLRTDETSPCCGGFAEFWAFSDTTHSYAYVRAQRDFQVRSDDFFVSNFLDNGKFKMYLNMDAIATHPTEDTSQFRLGNFTDRTNFFTLSNIPASMKMELGSVDGIFFYQNNAEVARFDSSRNFWLYDASAGTVKQVSFAANDSCGAGFKCLKIAN